MKRRVDRRGQDFGLADLIAFFRRSAFAAFFFAIAASAFTYWELSKNPSFTASGLIMIEDSQSNRVQAMADKMTGFNSYSYDSERQMESLLLLMTSRGFAEVISKNLITSGRLKDIAADLGVDANDITVDKLATQLLGAIKYSRKMSNIIQISISQQRPERAEALVNIFLEEVMSAIVKRESLDISQAHSFLESQMKEVESKMLALNESAEGYSEGAGPLENSRSLSISNQMIDLRSNLLTQQTELSNVKSVMAELEAQAENEGATSIDKYGATNALARLKTTAKVLQMKVSSTEKILAKLKAEEENRPDNQKYLDNLHRQISIEYQLVSDLKKELMALNVQRISAQNKFRVLESAFPGSAKANSNLHTAMLKRAIFAAIIACLLIFFGEVLRPVVQDNRSLQHTGISYLGSIPNLSRPQAGKLKFLFARLLPLIGFDRRKANREIGVSAIDFSPDSHQDIVIKNLRMRISGYRSPEGVAPKVIAFMSAASGEGKTFLTSSVGRSLASGGRRVLLIDADLRQKSLSQIVGFAGEKGLSEYLEEPEMERSKPLVRKIRDKFEALPAGKCRTNATEIISSRNFEELISAMREFYDYIVIDSPPALPYSEVITIAQASDLVVLSTFVGKTTIQSVDHVIDKLIFGSTTPIGYVLNMNQTGQIETYYPYGVSATKRLAA